MASAIPTNERIAGQSPSPGEAFTFFAVGGTTTPVTTPAGPRADAIPLRDRHHRLALGYGHPE